MVIDSTRILPNRSWGIMEDDGLRTVLASFRSIRSGFPKSRCKTKGTFSSTYGYNIPIRIGTTDAKKKSGPGGEYLGPEGRRSY